MSHAHVAVPRVPCRDWSPALLELGAVLTTFDSSEDCMSQIRDAECLLSEANFRDAFSPVLYASFTQWWEGGKAFWNVTYWMENHWVLLSRTLLFNWNFQITIFNSTPVDKRHVFKPRQTFNWASLELQFVFKVCWQKNILFLFKLWSWVSKCTLKWCSWACCVVCFIVFFSLREQFWLHIPTPYSPFSFAASAVRAGICSPELGRPREGEVGYLQPGLVQLRQDSVRTACRATRGPGWTVTGLCVCPEPLGWACTGVVKTLQHRRVTWLHLPFQLALTLGFPALDPLERKRQGCSFTFHGAFAPKSSRIQALGCLEFLLPAPQLCSPVCWATSKGSAKAWIAGAAPYHAEGEVPAARITRACCLLPSQVLFL